MPRQKLPEGWGYNAHGEASESAEPLHIVWFADISKEVASDHEDAELAECVPASVALAVIRNAGLDELHVAAKRFIECYENNRKTGAWDHEYYKLKELIESLEEPECKT